MIYTKNNEKIITKSIIRPIDNKRVQEYCKNISKNDYLNNTNMILTQSLITPRLQTEQVFFNFDNTKIDLFEQIVSSNLSSETIKSILSDMNSLKDFYYLTYEVLELVKLEPLFEYKIEDLSYIDSLCNSTGVTSEASDILKSIDKAEKNAKILELVKNI